MTTPGYWIAAGWVTRSQMYLNGYEVTGMPTQSDMTNGRRWIRPGNTADVLRPAKFVDSPNGQRWAYGGIVFVWPMVNLSPKMVNFLQTTFFPGGGTFFQRAWSAKITAQTFNRSTGEWETYHTWARFANPDGEAEPSLGGYNNLQIAFTAVAVATEGVDFEALQTWSSTSLTVDTPVSFTTRAENVGDAASSGSVILNYAIPSRTTLVSLTPNGGTAAYSTNNGGLYSGTPPGDLSTVTNLRVTFSSAISAGAFTPAVTIQLNPETAGTTASVVSWTNSGDGNTGNNTQSTSLTISA